MKKSKYQIFFQNLFSNKNNNTLSVSGNKNINKKNKNNEKLATLFKNDNSLTFVSVVVIVIFMFMLLSLPVLINNSPRSPIFGYNPNLIRSEPIVKIGSIEFGAEYHKYPVLYFTDEDLTVDTNSNSLSSLHGFYIKNINNTKDTKDTN